MNLLRLLFKPIPARVRKCRVPRKFTSDEDLFTIWRSLQLEFFPNRVDLLEYVVCWSTRKQRRVLASCHVKRKKVTVARELGWPNYREWLVPVLYHEMCHAVIGIGVPTHCGKRAWHGAEFKKLEALHPKTEALDFWIKSGGWSSCIRSDRARRQHIDGNLTRSSRPR